MSTINYDDIPKLTTCGHYQTHIQLAYLEDKLNHWINERTCSLDINPDFQRAHVWTEDQQRAFVEYLIRGGRSGLDIYFNCAGWMHNYIGPFVLVDGKQRLEACRRFLSGELKIFDGHTINDFENTNFLRSIDLIFHVNDLDSMEKVLIWYLEMNSGGTPHTEEELNKVRKMLNKGDEQ
jgi:hypothetical protein